MLFSSVGNAIDGQSGHFDDMEAASENDEVPEPEGETVAYTRKKVR